MLKLSTLIREGGSRYTRPYGAFVELDANGNICKACLIAAAALVAGISPDFVSDDDINVLDYLSATTGIDLRAPLPGREPQLWEEIAHKSDCDVSADDVANWLDSYMQPALNAGDIANPRDMDSLGDGVTLKHR